MPKIEDIKRPDGTQGKGIELNFKVKREEWNEYELDDGTILRVKNSLLKAFIEVDEDGKPKKTDDGEPAIVIKHSTLVVSRQPEED